MAVDESRNCQFSADSLSIAAPEPARKIAARIGVTTAVGVAAWDGLTDQVSGR